jgi:tetratricopeptide (TPR) repeat protein
MPRQVAVFMALLAVLVFGANSGTAQTARKDPDELLAKAIALHQSGDTLGAIQYYEAVLDLQPKRVEALSNLGAAYVRLGRYEEAIEQYRKALDVDPDLIGVRLNLGLAFYKADRIADAMPQFEAVLEVNPKHAAAALLLADCELRSGESAKVVELLSPLESELGKDRAFSYLLGTALIEQNELARGQQIIDRLFRDGDSAEGRVLMAAQYLRTGMAMKAVAEMEKAVQMNPDLPGVHALYARALQENHDNEGAAREYARELEKNPNDFESNLWLGLLRRDEDRLDEAMEYLKRASRMRPGDPAVAYALGRIHLAAGRLEDARAALERLVKAAPGYQQGHVLLATVYYRLNLRELGDEQRAVVDKLRAEAKETGAAEPEIGPTSFGKTTAQDGKNAPSSTAEPPPQP